MELEKILKEFKNIEPRAEFSKISRATILATTRTPKKTWAQILWPSLRFSSGALITGFLIVIIVGAFSTGINSRVPLASLDPITLKAEAEAIDIQIQLTALGYDNPLQVINDTSTPSGVSIKKVAKIIPTEIKTEEGKETTVIETEPVITIEEALEVLVK
ncbi:MAG: hypothetical protein AAB787_03130 [Patescibacteria group bacterium]